MSRDRFLHTCLNSNRTQNEPSRSDQKTTQQSFWFQVNHWKCNKQPRKKLWHKYMVYPCRHAEGVLSDKIKYLYHLVMIIFHIIMSRAGSIKADLTIIKQNQISDSKYAPHYNAVLDHTPGICTVLVRQASMTTTISSFSHSRRQSESKNNSDTEKEFNFESPFCLIGLVHETNRANKHHCVQCNKRYWQTNNQQYGSAIKTRQCFADYSEVGNCVSCQGVAQWKSSLLA